eukprot:TRINITY_DN5867_c0_g1_i1.p1 TRINITY_DN5867_c0_g1~~TRINITY_DN5867_c0_g1_i1.p1  ORF type:complete len:407 (+),score=109.33 TRINITY_DN5867_c0_g1_i1:35-1222(+)
MAVPMMQYVQAVPPMQFGFAPPCMSEVNRQVYELPPQPSQPLPMHESYISGTDQELLHIDTGSLGHLPGRDYNRGASSLCSSPSVSPVSMFSGPSLEASSTGYRRRRSMSCASGTSGVSDTSLPFRHDPYGETEDCVYIESSRTPSPPPQASPALSFSGSAYSITGIPPLEGSSSFSYTQPSPTPQYCDSAPFAPINTSHPILSNVNGNRTPPMESAPPTRIVPFARVPQKSVAPAASISPLMNDVIRPAEQEEADKKKKKKEPKKAVAAMTVKIVDNKPRAERRRRRVRRDATPEEVEDWKGELYREEEQALSIMKAQVTKHRVPIVVHRAEYQFDRKKLTFHYTTKVAKPDFRSVLHDGFRHFKCRIWMNNCDPNSCEPGDRIDLNSECLPVW